MHFPEGGPAEVFMATAISDVDGVMIDRARVTIENPEDGDAEALAVSYFDADVLAPLVRSQSVGAEISSDCVGFNAYFCVADTVTVAGDGPVSDVRVILDVDHPHIGDLMVRLSHGGRDVILAVRTGESGSNDGSCGAQNWKEAIFTDDAAVSIDATCEDDFSGAATPSEQLRAFRGGDVSGAWTITVFDTYRPYRTGVFNGWSLEIEQGVRNTSATYASPVNTIGNGQVYAAIVPVEHPGVIADIDISVYVALTAGTSFDLVLSHPDGTGVVITRGLATECAFAGLPSATFDDTSEQAITVNQGCTSVPEKVYESADRQLSHFHSKPLVGDWVLTMSNIHGGTATFKGASLSFAATPNVASEYDYDSRTLNLIGRDSHATYETLLKTVRYRNGVPLPSPITRTITAAVMDESLWSAAGEVQLTMHNPAIVDLDNNTAGSGYAGTFTEKGAAVATSSGLSIVYDDVYDVISATVSIVDAYDRSHAGASLEVLNCPTATGSSVVCSQSFSTGTCELTFSAEGGAPMDEFIASLAGVTYQHNGRNLTGDTRQIRFQIVDASSLVSVPVHATIGLINVNDAPEIHYPGSEDGVSFDTVTHFTEHGDPGDVVNRGPAYLVEASFELFDADDHFLDAVEFTVMNVQDTGHEFVSLVTDIFPFAVEVSSSDEVVSCDTLAFDVGCTLGFVVHTHFVYSFPQMAPIAAVTNLIKHAVYNNTAAESAPDNRFVQIAVVDSDKTSAPVVTTVTVTLINDNAPTLDLGDGYNATHGIDYIENAADLAVCGGIFVTDADLNSDFPIEEASVKISPISIAGDSLLGVTTEGTGIFAEYEPLTGVLSLSGSATVAEYQAVLRTLQYVDTTEEPVPGARTVAVTVNDGRHDSNTANVVINMLLVNDQRPILDLNTADITSVDFAAVFAEEGEPIAVVSTNLSLTDADSGEFRLLEATVTIVDGLDGAAEFLTADSGDGVSVLYDSASYELTLTGPATVAAFEAALRTVTYENGEDEPRFPGTRSIEFSVFDGVFRSVIATTTVTIEYSNDAPQLDLNGAAAGLDFAVNFTEGEAPVALVLPELMSLSDNDDTVLVNISITLDPRPDGDSEYLSVDVAGMPIAATVVNQTLTLEGPATLDNFSTVLLTLRYANDLADPGKPSDITRTITFVPNDGTNAGFEAIARVSFQSVNDAPIIDLNGAEPGTGFSTLLVEGGPAIAIVSDDFTLIDVDNATVDGAIVKFTSVFDRFGDVLAVDVGLSPVAAVYDAENGALHLSGRATVEDYAAVLGSATYSNTLDEPSPNTRSIEFTVSDGDKISIPAVAEVVIEMVNDVPKISFADGADDVLRETTFVENTIGIDLIGPVFSVYDPDDTTLQRVYLNVTNAQNGELEQLSFNAPTSSIFRTPTDEPSALHLFANAPISEWIAVLKTVQYHNFANEPWKDVVRNVSVQAVDAHGGLSNVVTVLVHVVSNNDRPVLTPAAPELIPVIEDIPADENTGTPLTTILGGSVIDPDHNSLAGIAVIEADNSGGMWQYTIDEVSWFDIVDPSPSAAVLIMSEDATRIRFVPNANTFGRFGISYVGWDRTSGVSGVTNADTTAAGATTAYSTASDTATQLVIAVNDRPVVGNSTVVAPAIDEDDVDNLGFSLRDVFVQANVVDVDPDAAAGAAFFPADSTEGVWEYATAAGDAWAPIDASGGIFPLNLDSEPLVRFVPAGNFYGRVSLPFYAWDATDGLTSGITSSMDDIENRCDGQCSSFSEDAVSISLSVRPINDQPELFADAAVELPPIEEDIDSSANHGAAVTTLTSGIVHDADVEDFAGMAVIAVNENSGTWQVADGLDEWHTIVGASDDAPWLLGRHASIRFKPHINFNGHADFIFRIWDGSSSANAGGSHANEATASISALTATASIEVLPVNDRPIFNGRASALPTIAEDIPAALNLGSTVGSIVRPIASDVDENTTIGMAITGTETPDGAWQYMLSEGSSWTTFFGDVLINGARYPEYATPEQATLLGPNSRIRFLPNLHFHGNQTLLFRAWDMTSGLGGQYNVNTLSGESLSHFSAEEYALSVTVTSVNDVPIVDLDTTLFGTGYETTFVENGEPVAVAGSQLVFSDYDHSSWDNITITLSSPPDAVEESLVYTGAEDQVVVTTEGLSHSFVLVVTSATDGGIPLDVAKATVQNVAYFHAGDEPTLGARHVSIAVADGEDISTAHVNITIQPVNDHAPRLSLGSPRPIYLENGPFIATVDVAAFELSDADHNDIFNMRSATATILGVEDRGSSAHEQLRVDTSNSSISATYEPLTGVLSLSGSATVAEYQAVLRTLQYVDATEEPVPDARTVAVTVNDGRHDSNTANVVINMLLVNDQRPILDLNTADITSVDFAAVFAEEGEPIAVVSTNLSLTDADSGEFRLLEATVTIVDGLDGAAEFLTADSGDGVSVLYDSASYELTLTGPATVAAFEAALRTVTYENGEDEPRFPGTRSIEFSVFDGVFRSVIATTTVTIEYSNDAPQLDLNGAAAGLDYAVQYVEGSAPVLIADPTLVLIDDDDAMLTNITVTLTSRPDGSAEHLVAVADSTHIESNYADGRLLLEGPDSVANFAKVLRTVGYYNGLSNPGKPSEEERVAEFVVNDGTDAGIVANTLIVLESVNDAPIVHMDSPHFDHSVEFVEEGPAVLVVGANFSLTDIDSDMLHEARATLAEVSDGALEVLKTSILDARVTSVYEEATGVLSVSGEAPVAAYREILSTLAYENLADEPSGTLRTVVLSVYDGDKWSDVRTSSVSIVPINDPPRFVLDTSRVAVNLNEDVRVTLFPGSHVEEDDDVELDSAIVRIANAAELAGNDVLSVPSESDLISWSYADGTLRLNGRAPLAEWDRILGLVTFEVLTEDPVTATRQIEVIVHDPSGSASEVVTTSVSVSAVNDAPRKLASYPYDIPVVLDEDASVELNILPHFTDPDDTLDDSSVIIDLPPAFGTITEVLDGAVVYSPEEDYFGMDSFTYRVCDSTGLCDRGEITLNVTSINDRPTASDLAAVTNEDTAITIDISALISDKPNENENPVGGFNIVRLPVYGQITGLLEVACDNSGPAEDSGATDGSGDDGSGDDGSGYDSSGDDGSGDDGSGYDSSGDGGSGEEMCWKVPASGLITYTPEPNWNSAHAGTVEVIPYRVCDYGGLCAYATISIDVQSVNDVPTSVSLNVSLAEDTTLETDLAALVSDIEEPPSALLFTIALEPAHGVAIITDHTLFYTPDLHYHGTDGLTFTACDAGDLCTSAEVHYTVGPVNDRPSAASFTFELAEDSAGFLLDLKAFSHDIEDSLLGANFRVVTMPQNGTLSTDFVGTSTDVTYTPNPDYYGPDGFRFEVCDNFELCAENDIIFAVIPRNDPPFVEDLDLVVDEDTEIETSLLALVEDKETVLVGSHLHISQQPQHGTVHYDPITGRATYLPVHNYNGLDRYFYMACDASGACREARVGVTITPINDPPVVRDIVGATTEEDTPYMVMVRSYVDDVDNAGDELAVTLVTESVDSGSLLLNERTGIVLYTPHANYHGTETFEFRVCDPYESCSTGTATIAVTSINDAPAAADFTTTLIVGESHAFDVVAAATDADESEPIDARHVLNPMNVRILTQPAALENIAMVRTVVVDGQSRAVIDYIAQVATSANGFYGTETLEYEVCDYYGACATAKITVTVDLPGPQIVAVTIADPDNADFVFSNGDTLTVEFNEATNIGSAAMALGSSVQDKAAVDRLFDLGSYFEAGTVAGYTGMWAAADTFVVTFEDCLVCVCVDPSCDPRILSSSVPATVEWLGKSEVLGMSATISVRPTADIRNVANRSLPSESLSPPIRGDWGKALPAVTSITLDFGLADTSPAEVGKTLPRGTKVTLGFNGPLDRVSCTEALPAELNQILHLQLPEQAGLSIGQLGSIAAQWSSSRGGCPDLDLSALGIGGRRARRAGTSVFDSDQLVIWITNSNGQTISSQADLRDVLSIQADAYGSGLDNYLGSADPGATGVTRIDLPENADWDPVVDASLTRGPSITSFEASDPDNRDNEYSDGDVFTIQFSHATDVPPVSSKVEIESLFEFWQDGASISLGFAMTGVWVAEDVLEIRVSDVSTPGIAMQPRIAALQVRLRPGAIHVAGNPTSVNSVELSSALGGSFGTPVRMASVYWALPVGLLAFIVLFAFIVAYKLRRPSVGKKTITRMSNKTMQSAVSPDTPWVRPPAIVAMRQDPDPFGDLEKDLADADASKAPSKRSMPGTPRSQPGGPDPFAGGMTLGASTPPRKPSLPGASPAARRGSFGPRPPLPRGPGPLSPPGGPRGPTFRTPGPGGPRPAFRRPSFGAAARGITAGNAFRSPGGLPPPRGPGGSADPFSKTGGPVFLPPVQRGPGGLPPRPGGGSPGGMPRFPGGPGGPGGPRAGGSPGKAPLNRPAGFRGSLGPRRGSFEEPAK